MTLAINTPAPDFELADQNGTLHRLSDYLGKRVVLYFYPKDDTSGCTAEAIDFTQLKAQFEKVGATVIGVVGSEDEQSDTNPFQRTSGQYRLGYDDGVMRSTADSSRRFDRWAVVSYGRDGISDRTKTGAGNESIRDDVFYVFGFVPGESFYKAF